MEIIEIAIANLPNFLGLVILAWVLLQELRALRAMFEAQLTRYDKLVEILLQTDRLSPSQAAALFKRVENEK